MTRSTISTLSPRALGPQSVKYAPFTASAYEELKEVSETVQQRDDRPTSDDNPQQTDAEILTDTKNITVVQST